jgi:hypothetical protein
VLWIVHARTSLLTRQLVTFKPLGTRCKHSSERHSKWTSPLAADSEGVLIFRYSIRFCSHSRSRSESFVFFFSFLFLLCFCSQFLLFLFFLSHIVLTASVVLTTKQLYAFQSRIHGPSCPPCLAPLFCIPRLLPNRIVHSGIPSHIPVRSPGQVPIAKGRDRAKRRWSDVHERTQTHNGQVSILRPRIVKMMFRSASSLQQHLVCPVRGLQLLCLHNCRLPSPLHPRSRQPSYCVRDPIRFLRLPSQRSNLLLQDPLLCFPAQAYCLCEHLHHPGAGFLHLALFVERAC